MIQRVQTLLLALVIVLGVLLSFLPILQFSGNDITAVMNAYKTVSLAEGSEVITKNMGVGVLQGVILIVALIVITLYKNRSLQMKLAKLNILLIALQIAAIVMYSDTARTAISSNSADVSVGFQFGAIIPVLSLIFTYLAIRFIKKDDELVRSADRLR